MICKPGSHYVSSHTRLSKSGASHTVRAHCRQNPRSKKYFLYKSNLDYIYQKQGRIFKPKKLKRIKGYPQDKGQYDKLIQFWLKYWEDQKLIKDKIDPLLVKTIIAVESSFREKVITKMPGSSAQVLCKL